MRNLLLIIGIGCAVPEEGPLDLVFPDAWAPGELDADPVARHQPSAVDCPPSTWGEEGGRLEVQTGACSYAWLVQPLQSRLREGDAVTLASWHQGLDAPLPAEGHLAIVVDGEVWWDTWAAIPSDPEVWDVEIEVPVDVREGSLVGVHLHNHGFNSWSVGALRRWPGGREQ